MAIVMVSGVRRAGAVLVIDEETASFTGKTYGSPGTFQPPFEPIVRLDYLPNPLIRRLSRFSWRGGIAARDRQFLNIISTPGDRHFHRNLRKLHLRQPALSICPQVSVIHDVQQLPDT